MNRLLEGICALALATLACNILNTELRSSSQSQSAIATIVAQTMQAVKSASKTPMKALETPALMTPSPSATPAAIIQANAYCRMGPGENYKSIASVKPNQTAALIGKDTTGNYWLIQTSSGACWVASQYVAITGGTQNIPEMTPPPSTTADVPARPTHMNASASCGPTSTTNILTWTDNANNETGYYVLRFGNIIADLPPNSTTYTDTVNISPGTKITYGVEAYNDVGVSGQLTITSICQ